MYSGDSKTLTISIVDGDGDAVDVSTAASVVYAIADSSRGPALVSKTLADGVSVAGSTVTVTLEPDDTAAHGRRVLPRVADHRQHRPCEYGYERLHDGAKGFNTMSALNGRGESRRVTDGRRLQLCGNGVWRHNKLDFSEAENSMYLGVI
jgi:hypothetical protein